VAGRFIWDLKTPGKILSDLSNAVAILIFSVEAFQKLQFLGDKLCLSGYLRFI
jgi:hypothetical protein